MLTRRNTLILLTVLWPVMLVMISVVRFSIAMFSDIMSSPVQALFGFLSGLLIFALIGWLSGLLLLAFIKPGRSTANIGAVVGYIIAAVPAAWFAIVGGLLFPIIGQTLYGLSVIGIGVVAGRMFGSLFGRIAKRLKT